MSVESKDANLRRMEQITWRAARSDLVAIFEHWENLPTVMYQEELFMGNFLYVNRAHRSALRDGPSASTVNAYSRLWPLPVGRGSLHSRLDADRFSAAFIADSLPFEGDELAGWIVDTKVGTSRVEAFGLVRMEGSELNDEEFVIDGLAFRLSGASVTSSAVRGLCDNMGRWWNSIGGQAVVKPGRRIGTGIFRSAAEFHVALLMVMESLKSENIKADPRAIISRMQCGKTTYYKCLKEFGMPE